ncbi:MAG TPA: hypothetical protein VF583_00690, partial [Bradyrhizobium sp.]
MANECGQGSFAQTTKCEGQGTCVRYSTSPIFFAAAIKRALSSATNFEDSASPASAGQSHMAAKSLALRLPRSSWPGLSRPSTSFSRGNQDVDARHKAGHDEFAERSSQYAIALSRKREMCSSLPRGRFNLTSQR